MSSTGDSTLSSGYSERKFPDAEISTTDAVFLKNNAQAKPGETTTEFPVETFDSDSDDIDVAPVSPAPMHRSDSANSVSFLDLSKLLVMPDYDFGTGFDHMSDSTKRKFTEMKNKTREKLRRLASDTQTSFQSKGRSRRGSRSKRFSSQDLARFQESLNRRLNKFDNAVQESLQSSATEKAFYAFAVTLIAAAGFTIGKYPVYFPIFHTVVFGLLMPIRFYSYFKIGFQYYLADLCYYVNVLLLLFLWVFPSSKSLFVSVFALTLGTLSFAVITWRNSLVLHSIEKTTSSIIHVMPPLTMFVLVHETPKEYIAIRYPAVAQVHNWNFVNGILVTSIYYTIWQVSYHYFITVRRREQIANGRVTSFTYLKKSQSKSPLGKFVNSLPYSWMQVAAFTLIQFFYQIFTMLPCPIWFRYKHACGAFVCFIFSWSAYNGATYYIEVFGKRFEKEVKQLRVEINELQSRLDQQESERDSAKTSPEVLPVSPVIHASSGEPLALNHTDEPSAKETI
ncbi:hypothetical protein JCM33374_g6263 [Metschnikowia sp. JCM 33374]|nr:hypothetical protein JCM33374_g6263 [Metschnikowia sp. JCM 33374]